MLVSRLMQTPRAYFRVQLYSQWKTENGLFDMEENLANPNTTLVVCCLLPSRPCSHTLFRDQVVFMNSFQPDFCFALHIYENQASNVCLEVLYFVFVFNLTKICRFETILLQTLQILFCMGSTQPAHENDPDWHNASFLVAAYASLSVRAFFLSYYLKYIYFY